MPVSKVIQSNNLSVWKVDTEFKVIFANKYFLDESGYSIEEIINEPLHMLKHEKMPNIIITELLRNLSDNLNYNIISINSKKNRETYWVVNQVSIDRDSQGIIQGYTSQRKTLPNYIINKIEPFYNNLHEIEKLKGSDVSETYFESYLNEMNKSYQEYIVYLFKEEAKLSNKQQSLTSKTLNWFFNSEYDK